MGHFNQRDDIADLFGSLDKRISALEARSGAGVVPVGSGAPPSGQQDGSVYGDKAGLFFYIVLNGVAKKVAVA